MSPLPLQKIKSLFRNPLRREKVLGIAKEPRRYDLPLSGGTGNAFLRVLIGLMCILAMFAMAAGFALSAMKDRWSKGLENQASIEIPATDSDGATIDPDIVKSMTVNTADILKTHPDIENVAIVDESRLKEMLSPWLGTNLANDTIPLPGLISVTFRTGTVPDFKDLEADIREVAPRARIDRHESWLSDVARFTGALQFAALILMSIIGLTTLVAVAGGVRSKLSENKDELELLHLMGATDSYIARQLQKHMLFLSLQGAAGGAVVGAIILVVISQVASGMGFNLIPDFRLGPYHKAIMIALPLILSLLAMATARITVLRVLSKMP